MVVQDAVVVVVSSATMRDGHARREGGESRTGRYSNGLEGWGVRVLVLVLVLLHVSPSQDAGCKWQESKRSEARWKKTWPAGRGG